jgi:hypothetical protein
MKDFEADVKALLEKYVGRFGTAYTIYKIVDQTQWTIGSLWCHDDIENVLLHSDYTEEQKEYVRDNIDLHDIVTNDYYIRLINEAISDKIHELIQEHKNEQD